VAEIIEAIELAQLGEEVDRRLLVHDRGFHLIGGRYRVGDEVGVDRSVDTVVLGLRGLHVWQEVCLSRHH